MNPWAIKKEDFPRSASLEEKIKFVLRYAILAPSIHNIQPWLFKIGGNYCEIYYDRKLKLPEADPKGRDLYITMGCMVENLLIAANYFGIFKEFKLEFKDNFIGTIYFENKTELNQDLQYLLEAIPARINARGIFNSQKIPTEIEMELLALNKDQRLIIKTINDKKVINRFASLTAQGLKMAHGRPSFRKEMSKLMFSSLSMKRYGLPGYSLKMPFVLSFIIPTLVKFFDMSFLLAKLNYNSISSAPGAYFISSEKSNPEIWFEVGRLAERLMLHLNSKGIVSSIFIASIEMGNLYKEVQKLLGNDLTPHFVFCAGYMKSSQKHSPRINLEDKLLVNDSDSRI